MANLRPMLFVGLLVLAYMMWIEWQKDYGPQPKSPTPTEAADSLPVPPPSQQQVPAAPAATAGDLPTPEASPTDSGPGAIAEAVAATTIASRPASTLTE